MRTILLAVLLLAPLLAGCAAPDAGEPPAPTPSTPPRAPANVLREDFREFTLAPKENIEWKLWLAEGARMEYDWSAERPVYFDFHGDFDDGTEEFESHKEGTLASDGGTFLAPFAGRHGWYFANNNAQTVTIALTTSGDYEVVGRTGGNAPP